MGKLSSEENAKWLTTAYENAVNSPDPSTQNGAVLVNMGVFMIDAIGRGCNTFPKGVRATPDRLVSPKKYSYVEHAERSAIYDAALRGHSCHGATLYCPWFACVDCARAIILSGIKRVVGHKRMMDMTPDRWKESIAVAFEMFAESGVETELFEDPLPAAPAIRFNGEMWQP